MVCLCARLCACLVHVWMYVCTEVCIQSGVALARLPYCLLPCTTYVLLLGENVLGCADLCKIDWRWVGQTVTWYHRRDSRAKWVKWKDSETGGIQWFTGSISPVQHQSNWRLGEYYVVINPND